MDADALARLRLQYSREPLVEAEMAPDPFTQFDLWFDEIADLREAIVEPNAMVLSTADDSGRPSSRTVLLKAVDDRGFVLFTNYGSRKGREADENPWASLVFPWYPVQRQVCVAGAIERVDAAESADYFRSRPRDAQIGAWASRQSSVVRSREQLEERYAVLQERFDGAEVPVPDFWGGLRVVPITVEFWHGRENRLHDRLRYRFDEGRWFLERLSP